MSDVPSFMHLTQLTRVSLLAVNYAIGMLSVHFAHYINAGKEHPAASLVFNPYLFRDFEACSCPDDLKAVDEVLSRQISCKK